eukprot:TRINITY_DN1779_c0_g2_i1.p1 TRINITY_DN1779_c0_g2~~TRINITY_DN1779_c0_g2_i1.p1  ORF type:complete len:402 (-),score=182.43 TRINITY_DN1779_c0_g2_i1:55-1260(-)
MAMRGGFGGRGGGRGGMPGRGGSSGPPPDPDVHHLAKSITCHAWSGDRTRVALCPNNNTIEIWHWNGTAWNKEHSLDEHDQRVTGIDWAPQTNRLVTCSEDRNAYVWVLHEGVWKPTLVILRINRAATHCKWSPNEDKFAVASGAKVVSVCYFEEDNDWWVSKHIKKHKSTVLSVDWHPNNLLLLTGAADFKARIFSAAVKGVDKRPREDIMGFSVQRLQFGELLMEMDAQAWVHSAQFSPSGQQVAFVTHDASLSVCDITHPENQPFRVKHSGLPFQTLLWVSEHSVVAAGHEYAPFLFQAQQDGTWACVKKLDDKPKAAAPAAGAKVNAFDMFRNKVNVGEDGPRKGTTQATKHQNCVTYMGIMNGQPGAIATFTTSGVDGRIVFWHTQKLSQQHSIQF